MERLKYSGALKMLCYILIPILAALIPISVVYTAFMYENPELNSGISYYETEIFADSYFEQIDTALENVKLCMKYESNKNILFREIRSK